MLFVKVIVLLLLGFVVISLFSGLFFLVRDKGQTDRTVNALTVRIGLSILAIIVVVVAAATGVIEFNPSPLSDRAAPVAGDREPEAGPTGEVPSEESVFGGGRRPVTPDD